VFKRCLRQGFGDDKRKRKGRHHKKLRLNVLVRGKAREGGKWLDAHDDWLREMNGGRRDRQGL